MQTRPDRGGKGRSAPAGSACGTRRGVGARSSDEVAGIPGLVGSRGYGQIGSAGGWMAAPVSARSRWIAAAESAEAAALRACRQ